MRIVGGQYGGRVLEAPKGHDVRPTSDKVRLAVFNMLNSRGLIEDAAVIDAFCGTGALGIEALSWGAARCLFIDKSHASLDLARANCAKIGIGEAAAFLLKDAVKMPPRAEAQAPATLVFLDPPYRLGLVEASLRSLVENGWLAQSAHIVAEAEKSFQSDLLAPMAGDILATKDYGDTRIVLARM